MFPQACFQELRSYMDKSAVAKYTEGLKENKQNHEMKARQYCYLTYFGPVLGIDMEDTEVSEDSDRSSDRSDDDDSRSRLLPRLSANHDDKTIRDFRNMQRSNRLSCPAPQCLTYHDELQA